MTVAVGLSGTKLGGYSTPLANALGGTLAKGLGTTIGKWGYASIIFWMLVSIFWVAFSSSFNTPSLITSMANEHGMLPKFIGKKNKHDAP